MCKVLLYYKYVKLEDPQKIRDEQYALCARLGIKGRIILANEGINGTVSGPADAIEEYMRQTSSYHEFSDIEWKVSDGIQECFPRLRVVVRDEIVTLGLKKKGEDVDLSKRATYIEPNELKELYEKNEEFYILDGRNEYEARIGKFKNSIYFNVDVFKDVPGEIKKIEHLKNKLVITYCTGGIRCEKFSAFLKENGFENVKQLHGGIHRYSDEAGGKDFEGEMYVFDGRISIPVNHVNPSVISKCEHCGVEIARFINCANAECNKKLICCEQCEQEFIGACSSDCIPKAKQWNKKRAEKQLKRSN